MRASGLNAKLTFLAVAIIVTLLSLWFRPSFLASFQKAPEGLQVREFSGDEAAALAYFEAQWLAANAYFNPSWSPYQEHQRRDNSCDLALAPKMLNQAVQSSDWKRAFVAFQNSEGRLGVCRREEVKSKVMVEVLFCQSINKFYLILLSELDFNEDPLVLEKKLAWTDCQSVQNLKVSSNRSTEEEFSLVTR